MRFETHRVSEYVVRLLQYSPAVRAILADGGDIIECALVDGAIISVHLIESDIALYEAEQILRANGERGVYSLFLFWRDLLLPDHGQLMRVDAWLATWTALYGGKIYGYDFNGPDIYLFPVHFDIQPEGWLTRFGPTIDPALLIVREVTTYGALAGTWRVAAFDGEPRQPQVWTPTTVEDFYAVLELKVGASRTMVKRAYRRLARQTHPDVNDQADANARMQALNDAYRELLRHLDD